MAFEELFADAERLKLRFVTGFNELLDMGYITEAQFEEIVEVIDRLHELSEDELAVTMQQLIEQVKQARKHQH
jgi:ribosomal protein S13